MKAFGFHLLEFCESESERASLSGKTVKVKVKGLSQANVSIWVLYSLGVCLIQNPARKRESESERAFTIIKW